MKTKHGTLKQSSAAVVAAAVLAISGQAGAATGAQSGNRKLSVTGLENDEGNVAIALFNAREVYTNSSEDEGAFQGPHVDIKGGQARHVFSDIRYGDYAIGP
jgi:uncharacterized protein (DUF2141 family)